MKRIVLVMFATLLALATNVYADGLKIGVVNMDTVIQKSALALSFNDKISKEFRPRQDTLNAAQKKLQDELDQLNYNSYKLTAEERNKLQAVINTDRRDFELQNSSLQKDLSAAQSQYTQALMAKLNTVIAKIAQDGHYDLIQTNASILFLNNTIDLTQEVVQQLK